MDVRTIILNWKNFFEKEYQADILSAHRKGKKSVLLDFIAVAKFNPELADLLLDDPIDTISAAEIAMEQFDIRGLTVRFKNLPQSAKVRIRDIRTTHLGKLLWFEATIRQTSDVRPKVTSMRFECPSCGNVIPVLQLESEMKEPTVCGCGRKGKFSQLSTNMIDCQRLKVEEPIELLEGNEQPRQFNVFLSNDLTEPKIDKKNTPGSKILISGVVKDIPITTRRGKTKTERDIMLECNYIQPLGEDFEEIKLSKEEKEKIIKFSKNPNLFDDLVKSYAPDIEGYEEIKLAIILQLFSGVQKNVGKIKRRGDIHILLIGDPSSGKSKMIRFAGIISPKSRYCSGGGSSGKGITASVDKDEFIGGWAVQAGALVLAHKGVCIVDEFDKLCKEDRVLMHEGLSEQTVSVDKASVHCTLKSETSCLAAGNPKFSRFSNYESVASQIDLPDSLISRFDLIFVLRDIPNEEHDRLVIDKIIEVHADPDKIQPAITEEFLKKYIAYARQKVKPTITEGAANKIKEVYLELRKARKGEKAIAITARQAEGLIRIAEASAKARLSSRVTTQDVLRAEDVVMYCLRQIALDPDTGVLDIDRFESKVPSSTRTNIHIITEILANHKDPMDDADLIDACKKEGLEDEDLIDNIIEKLKRVGDIIEVKPRKYIIAK